MHIGNLQMDLLMNNLQDTFPHYTLKETLRFRISADHPLPEGYYEVIDYYGPNFKNDNHRVTLEFLQLHWDESTSVGTECSLAVLNYDFNRPVAFDNPRLLTQRSPLLSSDVIVEFLSRFLESHSDYNQELNRRYEIEKAEALELERVKNILRLNSTSQMPIIKEQSIGRNDPCPCGSGKKYKQCHGTT